MFQGSSFEVREAVQVALSVLAKAAHTKGLSLISRVAETVPARLEGDPGRLRQVVAHLVSVAIKFTESGGVNVDVSLDRATPMEVVLLIGVHYTGAPVPDALLDRFYAENDTNAVTPIGIGGTERSLIISRRIIVEKMEGVVGVTNAGGSSTLWFTVRLKRTLTQPAPRPVMLELQGVGL